ncbi:hypothetical protein ACQKP0_23545 [Heyndrickxia sp. NPDC080065]|uniref:hypothetical protein n=1 Tax=Heyndrickxia sp. NPDC080065 TaxID=3390568 RepID=UPI003CFE6D7E
MEIIINNREFDENMVIAIKQAFEQIIEQLQELNLGSLQYIIVPDDFGKELIEFQQQNGLREGYTNNEFGIAVGKVLSYLDDGDFKTTIFFDPRIIYALFDENLKQNSIHYIHHEFCHVHDDYEKYRAFGVIDLEEAFFNSSDKVSQVAYAHADLIWSEYIATKLSAPSKPENHDIYVESLLSLIPNTKKQCEEEIKAYRADGNIDKLFGEIQLSTSQLLKVTAYFIGYCHGYNIDPPTEMNDFVEQYTYLDGVWGELPDKLNKLYESYGTWDDVKVFNQLADMVLILWGNLGVYPKNKDCQLYISVP